ncbi:MAG: type I DNA topoisomerase, partial [Leptospiraceae bacterium]|nr:type I DNA topoisomerase [Leptospiraceae bacterium]
SPLLWDIRSGLSAGRVQSTVLKWICDRQKEIEEFATEEYYEVSAELREGLLFLLVEPVDTSLKTLHLSSQKQVEDIIKDLNKLEKNETEVKLKVVDIQSEKKTRYPPPPFTTSTLQQEAYRRLKFPANKTMLLAQKLYEGVDIAGEGRLGFITYMRTDSVRISEEAALKRRIYIEKQFGKVFIGLMQRKSKKGNIQDAHEAIRPVSISREPKNYTNKLPKDLLDLYKLIWERFVVSGMAAEQSVEYKYLSKRKDYYFLNKQKEVVFEGFTVFTGENKKKEKPHHLEKGKEYVVEKFFWEKKNTEAPIPFTEATIIRKMESSGVGRPSTYASSLNVLFKRKYIRKEKNYLLPEELGLLVNTRLCENFIEFIDEKFTASIEKKLDLVEMKKLERLQLIKDFYSSLQKCLVQTKKKPFTTKKNNLESEPEKKNLCPLCNKGEIKVKNTGRGKKYQQCSRFPHCEFMEYI